MGKRREVRIRAVRVQVHRFYFCYAITDAKGHCKDLLGLHPFVYHKPGSGPIYCVSFVMNGSVHVPVGTSMA